MHPTHGSIKSGQKSRRVWKGKSKAKERGTRPQEGRAGSHGSHWMQVAAGIEDRSGSWGAKQYKEESENRRGLGDLHRTRIKKVITRSHVS